MKKCSLLLVALSLLYFPISAWGTTWSLNDDFPDTQGPIFYGLAYDILDGTTNDGTYRELTATGGGAYAFTTPGQPPPYPNWAMPYVRKNYVAPYIGMMPTADRQIVDILGSIYDAEDAIYAFKAPFTGTYDISYTFWQAQTGSTGVNVYVKKNDQLLWSYNNLDYDDVSDSLLNVALNMGDFIYFGVNAGATDYSDHTRLLGEITAVPLPPSALLLGSGLLGLAGWRRFRKG